jgi:hypothetical protein
VPALRDSLDQVNRSVAAGQWSDARAALDALIRDTSQARAAGTISDGEADRIHAAAARLSAGLPQATPTPAPTVTVRVTPPNPPPNPAREPAQPKKKGRENDKDDDED